MGTDILAGNAQDDSNPIARELRIDKTGRGTVTFRGVARICGVAATSLYRSKPSRGGVKSSQKTSESSSQQGFAGGVMFPAKLAQKLVDTGFDLSTFQEWKKNGIPDLAVAVKLLTQAKDAQKKHPWHSDLLLRSAFDLGFKRNSDGNRPQKSINSSTTIF